MEFQCTFQIVQVKASSIMINRLLLLSNKNQTEGNLSSTKENLRVLALTSSAMSAIPWTVCSMSICGWRNDGACGSTSMPASASSVTAAFAPGSSWKRTRRRKGSASFARAAAKRLLDRGVKEELEPPQRFEAEAEESWWRHRRVIASQKRDRDRLKLNCESPSLGITGVLMITHLHNERVQY